MHRQEPYFLDAHAGVAQTVAFHPKERHTFCSAGLDGQVNYCTALEPEILLTSRIANSTGAKYINSIKFNQDGSRTLATVYKRFSVLDVETGQLLQYYENVAFSGRDRIPLAVDPTNPHVSMFPSLNGKGLVTIDLRLGSPAFFSMNVHSTVIKDIVFLREDWPIGPSGENTIVTLSRDGVCKFTNMEGLEISQIDVKHRSYCLAPTPENFTSSQQEQSESHLLIGGDKLSCYRPAKRNKEALLINSGFNRKPMSKIRYLTNCYLFYTISCDEVVRLYKRRGHRHEFIGDVYTHKDEITDFDISPLDEYIVTCSRDGQVGVLRLSSGMSFL